MRTIEKKISKVGNSGCLIVDSMMTFGSGIGIGDIVEIKCQEGKLIITKKKGE